MAVPRETTIHQPSDAEGFDLGGGCAAVFRILAGIIAACCLLLFLTEHSNSVPTSVAETLRTGFVGVMALMVAGRRRGG